MLSSKGGSLGFLLGGHRGVGENLWVDGMPASAGAAAIVPRYMENTIASFKMAAGLGVDFVEFDVQVRGEKGARGGPPLGPPSIHAMRIKGLSPLPHTYLSHTPVHPPLCLTLSSATRSLCP